MSALAGNRLSPNHPPPRHGPIGGPGAWYGSKLKHSTEWMYPLSESERSEMIDAMRRARKAHDDIADMTKSDFAIPTFGKRLDELRREALHGRGFVLLRNFPVENFTFEEIATMYWGFGTYMGTARSQNARGHLLGHVTDITDRYDDPSKRGYLSNRHLLYHSDSVDMVSLLCLQKAKSGGLSTIVSSYTIHDEMWKRRPDLAEILYGPVPRNRRKEIPEGKGPWYDLPVFNHCNGRLAISFLRQFIDEAQDHPDVGQFDPLLVEALDVLTTLAEDPDLFLSMDFEPGDIQLIHNHQILHNRTGYEDWPEPERKRYLLRLWLSPPDGLKLPEAFAERYGSIAVGDRGGVVVPGTKLNVPLTAL
ncbi:MAG: TauD/TfdA family dioxygenase [Alphaproteobacteria bacterium]|nr:TauD/TfdA family dioxygenase [Alphaproteobacteria bacterium]